MSLKIGPDDQHQDILAKQSERHTGRKPEGKKTNKQTHLSGYPGKKAKSLLWKTSDFDNIC